MCEVHLRTLFDAVEEARGARKFQRVPPDVRNLQRPTAGIACFDPTFEAIAVAAHHRQSGTVRCFGAAFEQPLQAEAYPEHRPSSAYGRENRLAPRRAHCGGREKVADS